MKTHHVLYITLLIILSILLGCSSTARIKVQVQKPADIQMPGVKTIAVVDFQGSDRSGSQIATLVQAKVMQSEFFDIMEREKLNRILDEQNLGMAGIIDEATATEAGRLLGVDALIFGEVATYNVEPDKKISKKVKERRGTGKYHMVTKKDKKTGKSKKVKEEIKEEVWVDKSYWVRKGTVAINFRVVSVKTGRLLAAQSESKSYDSEKEKRSFWESLSDSRKPLKPKGEILADLSNTVCTKFVHMIAPYTISESRTIESGKGNIQVGKKYAESGLWPEAMEAWEQACQDMPDQPSAFYNLGLAYEIQGMLENAENAYKAAVRLNQKNLYMKAITRVRKAKMDQEKLENQFLEREE